MKRRLAPLIVMLICFVLKVASEEVILSEYSCTLFKTISLDSRVNIRSLPSLSGIVLGQLSKNQTVYISGISSEIDNIESFSGPWFRICIFEDLRVKVEGWVFSKYIGFSGKNALSEFEFSSFVEQPKKAAVLNLNINGGLHPRKIEVYPYKVPNQDYYTFVWNEDNSKFYYSDPSGSFIWYPKTNIVKHITYLGNSEESAWVCFSSDLKYMFEDFGTSPGPRGIVVYDIKNSKMIFSGQYYGNIELNGYSIVITATLDSLEKSDGSIDTESAMILNNFIKNTPAVPRKDGLYNTAIAFYALDVSTGKRTLIRCDYIGTQ